MLWNQVVGYRQEWCSSQLQKVELKSFVFVICCFIHSVLRLSFISLTIRVLLSSLSFQHHYCGCALKNHNFPLLAPRVACKRIFVACFLACVCASRPAWRRQLPTASRRSHTEPQTCVFFCFSPWVRCQTVPVFLPCLSCRVWHRLDEFNHGTQFEPMRSYEIMRSSSRTKSTACDRRNTELPQNYSQEIYVECTLGNWCSNVSNSCASRPSCLLTCFVLPNNAVLGKWYLRTLHDVNAYTLHHCCLLHVLLLLSYHCEYYFEFKLSDWLVSVTSHLQLLLLLLLLLMMIDTLLVLYFAWATDVKPQFQPHFPKVVSIKLVKIESRQVSVMLVCRHVSVTVYMHVDVSVHSIIT